MTSDEKNALRKLITSHPDWDKVRTNEGFKSDSLSVQDLTYLANRFGIPMPSPSITVVPTSPVLTPPPYVPATPAPIPPRPRNVIINPLEDVNLEPTPQPPMINPTVTDPNLEQTVRTLIGILAGIQSKPSLDVPAVIALIKEHSASPATVNLIIRSPLEVKTLKDRLVHVAFPLLLSALSAGLNVMLVGAAGSGKTTAAEQVASILELPYEFTGAIDSPYMLRGFVDAQGRIIHTGFRRAYEHGGVFLFDEMDGSAPAALLAFNAALANGHADFPDGVVKRHPSFLAIGAANTFGLGRSRVYVGRNQLDAASLDRFVTLDWDYDVNLERAMIGLPVDPNAPTPRNITPLAESDIPHMIKAWHKTVMTARAKVNALDLRQIVSPRATLNGIKLLTAGWSLDETLEGCIYKGMDIDTRAKIGGLS